MRATPLGVICSKLESMKEIYNTCALDTMIVHSDPVVIAAVATYCYCISEAIKNPFDSNREKQEEYGKALLEKAEKFVEEVVPE